MMTSLKPLGISLILTALWRNGLLNLGEDKESMEDYEQPKEDTTDENVELLQSDHV